MKTAVIGCGRWGSFLAWYLNGAGLDTVLYGRESSEHLRRLKETRANDYLTLPEQVRLTSAPDCVKEAEIVVISVGTQSFRNLCKELNGTGMKDKTVVLCMKGLEMGTGCRLSQIASQELDPSNSVAVWLGPGHVQDFVRGIPNCMVIDSEDERTRQKLVDILSGGMIRFYLGEDLVGNEIGAAAKNVVGIAAGMLDGMGRSSLKGALMARGTREIAGLIGAAGGKAVSAYGLCHLGDYEATVFSPFSHNRRYGEAFVKGESFRELAEGCYTVKALMLLGKRYGVELPICSAVNAVLYENRSLGVVLEELFHRPTKPEF